MTNGERCTVLIGPIPQQCEGSLQSYGERYGYPATCFADDSDCQLPEGARGVMLLFGASVDELLPRASSWMEKLPAMTLVVVADWSDERDPSPFDTQGIPIMLSAGEVAVENSPALRTLYERQQSFDNRLDRALQQERKRRSVLREFFDIFAHVLNGLPDGTVVHDGVIVLFASASAQRILEIPAVDLVGLPIEKLIAALHLRHPAFEESEIQAGYVEHCNGRRPVEVRHAAHLLEGCVLTVLSITDTTERQVIEARQARFELLECVHSTAMSEGLVLCGPDSSIVSVSPAAAQLLGFTEPLLLGKPLSTFLITSPAQALERELFLLQDLDTGESRDQPAIEARLCCRDGSLREVVLQVLSTRLAGRFLAAVTIRDVSQIRRALSAESYAAELRTTLLSRINHEIRTPLNGVLGSAEILLESTLSDEQSHWVGTIVESGHSLLAMLESLVEGVRAEWELLENTPSACDLLAEFATLADSLGEAADRQRVSLAIHGSLKGAPPVWVDSEKLRKAVEIIAACGIRHSAPGGAVRIDIGWSPGPEELCTFYCAVTDSGPRLRDQERYAEFPLFAPFHREGSAGDLSLGLDWPLASQLTRSLGGNMTAENNTEQGVRCELRVPMFRYDLDEPLATGKHSNPEAVSLLRKRRILIVGDDATSRRIAETMLRRIGATVYTAQTGSEALHLAVQLQLDAILLDLEMPLMSGWEAMRHLVRFSRERRRPLPPVVACTASLQPETGRYLEAGFFRVITRPIAAEELFEVLSSAVSSVPAR